ncbi:cell wall hydrolase [Anaerobacillus sp. MEB173]|uniref:cell wall hydrolase n=1 Tax=Anaerobacillus sp. MEB173 TaxID=3383345 RepID=UPI003F8FD502
MKKLFMLMITFLLFFVTYLVIPTTQVNAETEDTIQNDETIQLFYKINGIESNEVKLTELLYIQPAMNEIETSEELLSISNEETELLARLVHAEAKGEPYVGKVAVATVVLNRVEHEEFPDTIEEVIYQKNAFEPVSNGSISEPADKEAHLAVHEALTNPENEDKELLFFYNPKTATSDWIFTRKVIKTIGNHAFAI